jgi:hypothetical protein
MITCNELDFYIFGLLGQYDAWKLAMLPFTNEHPLNAVPSSDPFFAKIRINEFEIKIDSSVNYNESHIAVKEFLMLKLFDLNVNLDSSSNEKDMFSKIHAADVSLLSM